MGKLSEGRKSSRRNCHFGKLGLQTSEDSDQLVKETVPQIKKMSVLVQKIMNAGVEQKQGIEQVNSAIQQMNRRGVQENVHFSDEYLPMQSISLSKPKN